MRCEQKREASQVGEVKQGRSQVMKRHEGGSVDGGIQTQKPTDPRHLDLILHLHPTCCGEGPEKRLFFFFKRMAYVDAYRTSGLLPSRR